MANPKIKPDYQAQNSLVPFNMSCPLDFSSAPGMILPVFYCHLNQGEEFSGTVMMESRTEDIETQSFTCIHEFCDWFFVPYEQIYREWGSFYTSVDDVQSSLITDEGSLLGTDHPAFPYMPTGTEFKIAPTGSDEQQYFQYLLEDYWDMISLSYPNLVDKFGYPQFLGCVRLHELLGHRLDKSPVSGISGTNSKVSRFRIYENGTLEEVAMAKGIESLSLYAAYQKIWYDFFRDTDYDINDRFAYNLDRFAQGENVAIGYQKNQGVGMFQLRYRRWHTVYQNNFLPSPLQSIIGMLGQGASGDDVDPSKIGMYVNQWLRDISPTLIPPDSDSGSLGDGVVPTDLIDSFNSYSSAAQMDTLYALRKMSEITRRAGKHYDDQILAHFGVKIPRNVAGEVYYLGQQYNKINFQQVVSYADTDNAGLGAIGGKGYGKSHDKGINFKAPVSGLIMCVTSSMPDAVFPYGKDKSIKKIYREDFWWKSFDRLGMQPLFLDELKYNPSIEDQSEVVAWQYRYLEDKMKYGRSAGDLGLGASRSYWTLNYSELDVSIDQTSPDPYSVTCLRYVAPWVLDPIMKVEYEPNLQVHAFDYELEDVQYKGNEIGFHHVCNTDPLVHHFEFKCSKKSYMSTYGLPSL